MSEQSVAYEALNLSRKNAQQIEAHEDLCAERYGFIHQSIAGIDASVKEVKGVLWKVGGGAFSIIITVLGFLAVAQFNANNRLTDENRLKVEELQRQLIEERNQR